MVYSEPRGAVMRQMEVHSVQTSMRPVGRHRNVKRGTDRHLEALVHTHNTAASGVRKTVAEQLFRKLAKESDFAVGKIRSQLIPDSTWKRAGNVLGPSASQTVSRLANALFVAERIWQNEADAIRFLLRPHIELAQASPYSLLNTESGGRTVENLLAALEFGFPV
jgi:putative toxin-antitoxin system antitoxin component (TIGR02293 family)